MAPRGRPVAASLALLLYASRGFAQTSGAWETKLGGGATGLLLGAIKFMEQAGHMDACLSGIEAEINQYTGATRGDPTTRAGAINSFHYHFWSPAKPPKTVVTIKEPIEGGPLPQMNRYNEYDPYYVGSGEHVSPGLYDVRPTCISEFRVDTDKALEVAAKNGLPLGTKSPYKLTLIHAAGPGEPDWNDRSLRGKVFWAVRVWDSRGGPDKSGNRQYLVDARTAKFIKSRPGRVR